MNDAIVPADTGREGPCETTSANAVADGAAARSPINSGSPADGLPSGQREGRGRTAKAFYICGTHWDREWYEPFQEYRMWLVQNLDAILHRLRKDPRYQVFHLDGQAVLLEDYLEIRPERREQLEALLSSGRLVAGPWYAMPDLWLVCGEALIRNLTRGMRIVQEMGASPMPVGYTPDLFGHISSMPMIFAGLGLTAAVVWRGLNDEQVAAQFIWVGPDGSRVLTHKLPGHVGYGWFGGQVRWPWSNAQHDDAVLRRSVPPIIAAERARLAAPVLYLSDSGDHQTMPDRVPDMLRLLGEVCPDIEFVHGSIQDYFDELRRHADGLKEFHGELRHVARRPGRLYHALIPHCLSARYPLKQANDRCQNLLILWSEPLAAYALAAGRALPPGFLDTAWKHLLLNHPHDSIGGCSVDATHDDMPYRFRQAELLGDGVRRQAMARLTHVSAKRGDVGNLVVWNPLPWERRLVSEIDLLFPGDYKARSSRSGHTGPFQNQFQLFDADGRPVPYQVLEVTRDRTVKMPDEQGRRQAVDDGLDVYRVAVMLDLSAAGYGSLSVRPLEGDGQVRRQCGTLRTGPRTAANEHLRLHIAPDGTVELEHHASGRIYRDLFQYEDSGDTGDGWNYVPPLRNPVLVTPGQTVGTFLEEDGPLQVTFRIDRVLRVPAGLEPVHRESRRAETVELPVSDYLTLRAGDPLLHVRTVLDNTACDHRLRVLFPTRIAAETYWSDQPFAWVERPVATDAGSAEYKEPDPVERPHHTVFAIADAAGGLAVLCPEGLHEHSVHDDAQRTLALTLFRGVHKTPTTDGEPGAQTLGRLTFRYALRPFAGELPRGPLSRSVLELQAGIACHLAPHAPTRQSFCRIDAPEDVVMTALKPGQDGRSVIVRLWNTGSVEAVASIHPAATPREAWACDLNEQPRQPLAVSEAGIHVTVPAFGLATVRMTGNVETAPRQGAGTDTA